MNCAKMYCYFYSLQLQQETAQTWAGNRKSETLNQMQPYDETAKSFFSVPTNCLFSAGVW